MRLAGYAALFGVADAAGDVIVPGAFARAVSAVRAGRALPLFWQHRPAQAIGAVEHLAEDERGLRVIARIEDSRGRAGTELARRTVNGLSFGYRARRFLALSGKAGQGGRLLQEIDLFEVSLVTHPLQHRARVHLVR